MRKRDVIFQFWTESQIISQQQPINWLWIKKWLQVSPLILSHHLEHNTCNEVSLKDPLFSRVTRKFTLTAPVKSTKTLWLDSRWKSATIQSAAVIYLLWKRSNLSAYSPSTFHRRPPDGRQPPSPPNSIQILANLTFSVISCVAATCV